jgi:hypothetical protein
MRKTRPTRRVCMLVLLGVASVSGPHASFADNGNSTEPLTASEAAMNEERISPSKVTLDNLEAYKAQVRRDLPIGTPKEEVETYLTRGGIPHDYFGAYPIYGRNGNSFQGTLKNIGTYLIFRANLLIRILLDDQNKVRQIIFRVDCDAP